MLIYPAASESPVTMLPEKGLSVLGALTEFVSPLRGRVFNIEISYFIRPVNRCWRPKNEIITQHLPCLPWFHLPAVSSCAVSSLCWSASSLQWPVGALKLPPLAGKTLDREGHALSQTFLLLKYPVLKQRAHKTLGVSFSTFGSQPKTRQRGWILLLVRQVLT